MATPPKPDVFDPETPPPGFEKKLVTFWQERRVITPRLQLVHTNAASGEGSIQSSYNWSMRNTQPGAIHGNPKGATYYTIPHFQIDRDGRGALLLPLNRQSITNARANPFSIGIETADTGTIADPSISPFTPEQAESVALAFAYASWGFGIPLVYPLAWDGAGTACHTEPFGYPYWTSFQGKTCPGPNKKQQITAILVRAREIVAEWITPTTPTPPAEETDEMTDEQMTELVERTADRVLEKILVSADAHLGWKLAGATWRTTLAGELSGRLLAKAAGSPPA
jgi:hypothetical protein